MLGTGEAQHQAAEGGRGTEGGGGEKPGHWESFAPSSFSPPKDCVGQQRLGRGLETSGAPFSPNFFKIFLFIFHTAYLPRNCSWEARKLAGSQKRLQLGAELARAVQPGWVLPGGARRGGRSAPHAYSLGAHDSKRLQAEPSTSPPRGPAATPPLHSFSRVSRTGQPLSGKPLSGSQPRGLGTRPAQG